MIVVRRWIARGNVRRGISLIELMIALPIIAVVMLGAYRAIWVPYRMSKILNDASQLQVALAALDAVASDLQQADAATFPFSQLTPTGELPVYFCRTNLSSGTPYTFVKYAFVAGTNGTGRLTRTQSVAATISPTTHALVPSAGAVSTTILNPIAQPTSPLPTTPASNAPPLFQQDPLHPTMITVSVAYEPVGVTLPGNIQAVFTASKKVSLRN